MLRIAVESGDRAPNLKEGAQHVRHDAPLSTEGGPPGSPPQWLKPLHARAWRPPPSPARRAGHSRWSARIEERGRRVVAAGHNWKESS
ncbi:hypothetical protein NL676_001781 [Syzygium grande]|nr:hypothetical protein NL676_001781 [Syzygium grande]